MKPRPTLFAILAITIAGIAAAAGETGKPAFQYVGVAKCKRCHTSSKIGAQYKQWLESKHALAFIALASDSAKVIAAQKQVTTDPQKSAECLQCHVTGYGEPADHFVAARADSEGVGCESCHGAGSGYWGKSKMQELREHKVAPEKYGLMIVTRETCAKCHNEKSPAGTFVDWPVDSARVAHPIPRGYTTEPD